MTGPVSVWWSGVLRSPGLSLVSARFSTPLRRPHWLTCVVLDSVSGIGDGFWERFGNTVRLARISAAESLLMPARRRDHRDIKAAIGHLRTELREQSSPPSE